VTNDTEGTLTWYKLIDADVDTLYIKRIDLNDFNGFVYIVTIYSK
jgi:hypothetical protein